MGALRARRMTVASTGIVDPKCFNNSISFVSSTFYLQLAIPFHVKSTHTQKISLPSWIWLKLGSYKVSVDILIYMASEFEPD